MKLGLFVGAAALLLVSGCAANPFDSAVSVNRVDGLDFITRNPELDMVVASDENSTGQFCMSPETDAVPTQAVGFALNYSGQGSASDTSGDGAAALGGRSESVLITREILYRTCEFILNHDLNQAQAIALYQQALSTAQAISTSNTMTGTTAVDETASAPAAPN